MGDAIATILTDASARSATAVESLLSKGTEAIPWL